MGRIASKTAKVARLVSGVEKTADMTVQYSYNNWGALSQTVYPTTYTVGGASVPGSAGPTGTPPLRAGSCEQTSRAQRRRSL